MKLGPVPADFTVDFPGLGFRQAGLDQGVDENVARPCCAALVLQFKDLFPGRRISEGGTEIRGPAGAIDLGQGFILERPAHVEEQK